MNKTPKTDTARIDLRLKPAEKATIQRLAKQCGLSTTEYLVQRAIGYEVTTHFDPDGRQSVLEQFKELLLKNGLAPHI